MTARVRRIAVAVVAAALASSLGASVATASTHSAPQRVVADNHWCC